MVVTITNLQVENELRLLGANGTQKGFWCAYHGILLALEDPTRLYQMTKRLYPDIAAVCGMKSANVMRDLRTLVNWCWEMGDRQAMCRAAGRKLMDRPTVGEFIDLMAAHMRRISI